MAYVRDDGQPHHLLILAPGGSRASDAIAVFLARMRSDSIPPIGRERLFLDQQSLAFVRLRARLRFSTTAASVEYLRARRVRAASPGGRSQR